MDKEDLPSDSDESDVDYAPSDGENAGSEVESDGDAEEDTAVGGSDEEISGNKRKRKQKAGKKKLKASVADKEEEKPEEKQLNEEEEKKKTDSLWSDFLSDTSSPKPKPTSSDIPKKQEKIITEPELPKVKAHAEKVVVTKVFEFAGEEVRVTKEVAADSAEARLQVDRPSPAGRGRASGGLKGLSAVLGQLGKKEKIGTLEKSKLDWDRFKRVEGIEDEVQTHNRGKDGYLERQDFLQRADLRQFEIEKDMRTTRRSNR